MTDGNNVRTWIKHTGITSTPYCANEGGRHAPVTENHVRGFYKTFVYGITREVYHRRKHFGLVTVAECRLFMLMGPHDSDRLIVFTGTSKAIMGRCLFCS